MKTLRKFCATTVLSLALAFSAAAGDMSGPGNITEPPPPPPQPTSVTGDMSGPGTRMMGDTPVSDVQLLDPVTSLTLSLLESVFYLF